MTANIKRMQQALGLEKLTSDEVRDYLRKMSGLVFGDGGKWASVHVITSHDPICLRFGGDETWKLDAKSM